MEHALSLRRPLALTRSSGRADAAALTAWLVPAVLASYLGIQGGGFDSVVSSQVGITVWWILLLVGAFGLAPLRLTRAGVVTLGLLVAFAGWTTISLAWTQSSERTMADVSLDLVYVALALLVFVAQGRAAARHSLNGLAVGISVVAGVALVSRLHFAWFAPSATAQALPTTTSKLSYPLNYWNALADLMAIGVPLALRGASGARSLLWRALAGASVPLLGLCAWLTVSRGGAIAIVIAVVVFALMVADRLAALAVVVVTGTGTALLVAAADQRTAVRDGLRTALAAHQGNQMIAISIAVAVGVGLLVAAVALVERHATRPRLLSISRARVTALGACALLVAVVAFAAAGGFGFASREWTQFKTTSAPPGQLATTPFQRLKDATGNGRYQLWQAAVHEGDTNPWTGTGAGTFKFWWAQHPTPTVGFVEDAHSLYLQSLGELGYPGLVLIVALVVAVIGTGVVRASRTTDPERRLALAAATAGATAFAFAAAFEWIWLIPVLPLAFLVLAGAIATPAVALDGFVRALPASEAAPERRRRMRPPLWLRLPIVAACLGAAVAIALPMTATEAVRDSQALVRAGQVGAALQRANDATVLQPYAASPWLQRALVLELMGRIRPAVTAAVRATSEGPTDYDNWLVLSRLEARDGHARAALAAYLRARSLSPQSPLFSGA